MTAHDLEAMPRQSASGTTAMKRFPGWSVVWVAFVVAVFAWGIGFYGPAVFLQTLHATKAWPIQEISAAITVQFLTGAAVVAYLPEIYQSLGVARTTMIGACLMAIGLVAWAEVTSPWQLFIAAIISGSGWAVTSGAAINAMITPWFDRDRPKAISHAFNGASIGGVIFTPLLVHLISAVGFAGAALIAALSMIVSVVPLAHRYLRHSPADIGMEPDGRLLHAASPKQPEIELRLPRSVLMQSRPFVTASAAFAIALFAQVGVISHLMTRLSPVLGANGAAACVSLTAISAVAGRLLLGWLIGDHDRRHAACLNFLVQSIGVGMLAVAGSPAVLLPGCVLFGLGVGNVVALPPLIAQREFRAADVGTVVALIVAINQAAFALAPAILGFIRGITSSYAASFIMIAALQVIASMVVLAGDSRTN